MRVFQLTATSDAAGHLRLDLPVGEPGLEYEVVVVVTLKPAAPLPPALQFELTPNPADLDTGEKYHASPRVPVPETAAAFDLE